MKPTSFTCSLLYVESYFGTTDKSFTVFFARWQLNLIVDLKSQPVEIDNSTTGVTCAVEAKEKLI